MMEGNFTDFLNYLYIIFGILMLYYVLLMASCLKRSSKTTGLEK